MDMDFIFVLEKDDGYDDFCVLHGHRRLQPSVDENQSILVAPSAPTKVVDRVSPANPDLEWMQWTVGFPVLKVGLNYQLLVIENSAENRNIELDYIPNAIILMGEDSTKALYRRVQAKTLPIENKHILGVSVVGLETIDFVGLLDAKEEDLDLDGDDYYDDDFVYWTTEVDPWHMGPTRIIGILLFIATILGTWYVMRASGLRRQARFAAMEEEERQEELRGGLLQTEEGLDNILQAARRGVEPRKPTTRSEYSRSEYSGYSGDQRSYALPPRREYDVEDELEFATEDDLRL